MTDRLPGQAVDAGTDDPVILRIIRERVDEKRSAGIVVGILDPDGRTRVVAYGDPGPGQPPLDADSVFEIGSVTKVFTTTLLAEMVERGEVRLDDPVRKFLPPMVRVPARGGREITLQDLATQTSGLPRLPGNLGLRDAGNPYAEYTVEQLYTFLSEYELPRDVGSQFEYSNLGLGLLGHALALRAGTTYENVLRERIVQPLQMTMTGIALTPALQQHLAVPHGARGETVPVWDMPTLAGGGAIRSTAADLLRFAAANLGSGSGPLDRAMTGARVPQYPLGAQQWIGLGWQIFRAFERDISWHNGETGGSHAYVGLDPGQHSAVVVLSNSAASIDDIGWHLLDARFPLDTPIARREIQGDCRSPGHGCSAAQSGR